MPDAEMDARAVAVLRLLAETEGRDQHAQVTELRPEDGVLGIRHAARTARLHVVGGHALRRHEP